MIKNIELAQVRRGESFILDGVKFVKLDEDAHASFVLTADVFPKHIPFEHKDAERKDHDNYEMDISDDVWLCTHKLKEIGVDVEDWYRQKE